LVLVRARLRPILVHREEARLSSRYPRDELRHEIAPLSFHDRSPHQLPYLFPLPLRQFGDKKTPPKILNNRDRSSFHAWTSSNPHRRKSFNSHHCYTSVTEMLHVKLFECDMKFIGWDISQFLDENFSSFLTCLNEGDDYE